MLYTVYVVRTYSGPIRLLFWGWSRPPPTCSRSTSTTCPRAGCAVRVPWQEDRYDTVEVLAEVLLSWLEGARKQEKALAIVEETKVLSKRRFVLEYEGKRLLADAQKGLQSIPKWANEETKEEHWQKEREGNAKLWESKRLSLDVEQKLFNALSFKQDLTEGHELLVRRYLKSHKEAEKARNAETLLQSELRLHHHTPPAQAMSFGRKPNLPKLGPLVCK